MDTKTTGQIICELRKKKGLTQKALAEQLNVTDKAVSKWERDVARPDFNTMPKLAEILDTSIEELMNTPSKGNADNHRAPVTTSADDQSAASSEDWDPVQEMHKERAQKLILQGLLGFAIGFLFALATSFENGIGFAVLIGLGLSGTPYGYELLGNIIGRWYVVGHIAIMIIVFILKLAGALFIGMFTYPTVRSVYARSYAQSLGFTPDTSLNKGNAGYYPGLDHPVATMQDGYSFIAGCVSSLKEELTAVNGTIEGCRFNCQVEYYETNIYGDIYIFWYFYG